MNTLNLYKNYIKIILVGPVPPPLGGVSVYLYRLSKLLDNSEMYNFIGGGIKVYFKLFAKIIFTKADAIQLNVVNIKIVAIVLFVKLFKKVDFVFVDHNDQLLVNKSKLDLWLLRLFFDRMVNVVVVGDHIKNNYMEHYITESPNKIIVENAFLPPPIEDKDSILSSYPPEYFSFVSNFPKILITSAFKLVVEKGVDLYGIDMTVELLNHLVNECNLTNVGLVVFVADEQYNLEYINALKSKIVDYRINNNVLFITGQRELWPAYLNATLSIRATFRDGYGVSVSESIYLGCTAIASNVCNRAEGTILFKNRNQVSLNECVLRCLN